MFDIGFWEIAVIGVIALLVIGPERLPGVARNVGRWVGRMRRYVNHVKQDIEREIHADEVRQLLENPEGLEGLHDVARETASVLEDTRKELNSLANDAQAGVAEQKAPEHGVPHHGEDGDPFAPDSIASVSPGDSPVSLEPSAAESDAATTSDSPVDEKRPEQSRQR